MYKKTFIYQKRSKTQQVKLFSRRNKIRRILAAFTMTVIFFSIVPKQIFAESDQEVDIQEFVEKQAQTVVSDIIDTTDLKEMENNHFDEINVSTETKTLFSATMEESEEFPVELQAALTPTENFVRRLYLTGLGREPDEAGFRYWVNGLSSKSQTGAKAAENFLMSEELQNKSLSDEAFLNILYTALMDRTADASGRAHWKNFLESGASRYGVLRQFLLSVEFNGICNRYGIDRGDIAIRENRDANLNLTSFIFRQYTTIMGRNADIVGLNYWAGELLNKKASVEAVADFFISSAEFTGKNVSNEEYIKILYRAFMGREYDTSGLSHWVSYIDKGGTINGKPVRKWVFEEFAYSEEFRKIIESYGLTASTRLPQSEALKGKVIIIDPGHGGSESGAVKNGVVEKNINLEIAWLVKAALEAKGATVYMTRTSDTYVSLYNRNAVAHIVSMKYAREKGISTLTTQEEAKYIKGMEDVIRINSNTAASGGMGIMTGTGVGDDLKKLFELEHKLSDQVLFISIHANSNTSENPHGTQVYYVTDDVVARSEANNKDYDNLAESIFPRRPRYDGRPNEKNRSLSTALYQNIIGQVPALTTNSGSVIAGNYAYLREHGLVGAMVETGFLSNKSDSELLQKKEVQAGIAQGIVAGIQEYFG